jgi:hypothetical protein
MSLHFVASISSLVGISSALVACSGSSSSDGNGGASGITAGTNGMSGGATGNAAGTTSTSGGSGGDCPPLPACVADLATSCTSSGTCVEASTQPTDPTMPSTDARSYSNGVKLVTSASFDLSTCAVSFSSTVSKNGSTCFSFSSSDGATLAVKDGSDSAVATIASDASGNEVISCGGKTYTAPADCMSLIMPGADPTNAGTTCAMGTCAR